MQPAFREHPPPGQFRLVTGRPAPPPLPYYAVLALESLPRWPGLSVTPLGQTFVIYPLLYAIQVVKLPPAQFVQMLCLLET